MASRARSPTRSARAPSAPSGRATASACFATPNVTCGTEPPRKVSSIAFLAPGPSFINVQWSRAGSTSTVRVQRYRRPYDQTLADGSTAPQPRAAPAARVSASDGTWTVEDVIEASAKAPGPKPCRRPSPRPRAGSRSTRSRCIALADAGVVGDDHRPDDRHRLSRAVRRRKPRRLRHRARSASPWAAATTTRSCRRSCSAACMRIATATTATATAATTTRAAAAYSPYYGYGYYGGYGGYYPYYPAVAAAG